MTQEKPDPRRMRAVYLSDDEWREITAAAQREDRSASDWLRITALREARASDPQNRPAS